MEKERVLVTGGAGFIGSHIVDLLCEGEYEVMVFDTRSRWETDYGNDKAVYMQCDIRDLVGMKYNFEQFLPDYVIHCAAMARIQPSFKNPFIYYETNVLGTLNLLEFSKAYGVKKFVYSSSSSIYAGHTEMPLREDMPPKPLNVYADSKLMGEMLVMRYAQTFGVRGCSLRYFNVYGPRQPSEGQYATVAGIFLRQKKAGEPLTIVPDGLQRRSFTHVKDVAHANLLAMETDNVGEGEVINIGHARSYSILEVADIIGGKDYPRVFIEPRLGEARQSEANNLKARRLLHWFSTISPEAMAK